MCRAWSRQENMNIVSYETITKFKKKHAGSRKPLDAWTILARQASWQNFEDLKKTFGSADIFKECTIFDIGGNKYRLIAGVDYEALVVRVKQVLTHAEYNRDKWKKEC